MAASSFTLLPLLALLPAVFAALPPGWKACRRSASDYDACFTKEVVNAARSLKDGNKKLGVHPLDPLRIERLEIPDSSGPVSINLLFKNVDLVGITDLEISKAKNDWKKGASATVFIPRLLLLGDYKINGKVLVLPIQGEGRCNVTLDELELGATADWKTVDNGGKKYFQMKKFTLDLKPKHVIFKFENLFKGDKALGDNMNVFLNENWSQILDELKPALQDALAQAFIQISNNVLSKIPANEIDLK